MDEILKAILESICGPVGRLVLRLFGVKREKNHWVDDLIGVVVLLVIIFCIVFIAIKISD